MRVLVACEFSGIVRDAFRERGHDAWSCDLLPSERPIGRHLQGPVQMVLNNGWDLMIAHPPCTFLANSAAKHLYIGGRKENGRDEARWNAMYAAASFYRLLRDAPIRLICIENPRMIGYARRHIGGKHTQVVHPWQYGHGETKATCLELLGLPELMPTEIVSGRKPRVHHESPGKDRWKNRSRTLPGIAAAMAEQWGTP